MNKMAIKKLLGVSAFLSAVGLAGAGFAHEIAGPIDPAGNVSSFTVVAMVTCFNDNGQTDKLVANIRDMSPAVEGMFVNLTLFKGSKAISTTDSIPGDNSPSPTITLRGGGGLYFMIINKTRAGTRNVAVDYHCMTADNVHTSTNIQLSTYE